MSMPWIKLYTEILDDPKLGRLDDADKWRFVQLCLMAGECDAEGYLVNGITPLSLHDIAWRLRQNPASMGATMEVLGSVGLVSQDEDGAWFVTAFSKRQGRSQSERRAMWRERKRRQRDKDAEDAGNHGDDAEDVTRDTSGNHAGITALEGEREEEGEGEGEKAGGADAPAPDPPPTKKREPALSKAPGTKAKDPPPLAVARYRSLTSLYPEKALWPGIAEVVGEDPADLERFDKTVKSWMACGYNKRNVKGILQCYVEKRLPGDDHARASPTGPAEPKGFAAIRSWAEKEGISEYAP